MNEQTHTTNETLPSEETIKEVDESSSGKQNTSEESGNTSGQAKSEQVDFAQMYDMLTERDNKIKTLTNEISELKKTNTNLLLKVNASASAGDKIKTPYEAFVDSMVAR